MRELLHTELPYHPALDLLRCFGVLVGAATLARLAFMLSRGEKKAWDASQKSVAVVYGGQSVVLILQALEQFGQPLLVWRMPLLLIVGIAALVTLSTTPLTRGTDVNRTTSLYLVNRAAIEDALRDRDLLQLEQGSSKEL